jgi:S1-C subfamily serine protease
MSDGVYFYQHINYNGYHVNISTHGDYNLEDMVRLGIKNDDVSSIKIIGNYEVYIYEHHNYSGRSYKLTSSISNFVNIGWNDLISSIKVRKINNSQASAPAAAAAALAPTPAPTSAPSQAPIQTTSHILDNGVKVYNKARDAIVTLTMIVGTSAWVGSGFFIKHNSNYYICTVAHNVITSTRNTKIDKVYASISNINKTGDNRIVKCSIIGVAGYADLAILRVNENIYNQSYLDWGDSRNTVNGSKCYVLGDPRGIDAISISEGVVRDNKYIYSNIVESVCLSAPIYGGNSGGPVVDVGGNVISLISYGYSTTDTLSWGTAQSIAEPVVNYIINNNKDFVGGTLNAVLYPVDAIYTYQNSMIPSKLEGYYVHLSYNTSNLNVNDIILNISNKILGVYNNQNTPSDIYLNPSTNISLTVVRASNSLSQNISLLAYPIYINNDTPLGSSNSDVDVRNIGPIVKSLKRY